MMHSLPDRSLTCWFCKKKAAEVKYTDRSGIRTESVCATCLDRLEVQDAFEHKVLETFELEEREQYDEIIAIVDTFHEANRHRDHDGWLARSIASHRACLLWQAERYAESLAACEVRERLGFDNVTDRWALGVAKAQALEGLERHQEALAAFEEAFSHQDPRFVSDARYFLDSLVEFSANAGQPVHEKWRSVARAVAEEYGVEMPVRDSLGESILALHEMTRDMLPVRARDGYREPTHE